MESRFKSNNFIAILIALILMATGFALAFLHRQSESKTNHDKKPVATFEIFARENDSTAP
jgi:hypothetical protein